MNDQQRQQLDSMIKQNNVEDQTNLIRECKNSVILRQQVIALTLIAGSDLNSTDKLKKGKTECPFLFNYFTELFNKILTHVLDISILHKLLDVLEQIEQHLITQNEGAFMVGTLLRNIYVDSVLKPATDTATDATDDSTTIPTSRPPPKSVSWIQWKDQQLMSFFESKDLEAMRVKSKKQQKNKNKKHKK